MSFQNGAVESPVVGRVAVQSIQEMLAQRLGPGQLGHVVIVENPAGTYTGYKLTGLPASDLGNWSLLGGGGGGSATPPEWDDVANKPTEFTPSAHTHPWSQVTLRPTLVDALAGLTGDGLVNKTGSSLNLISSTSVGISLLTATDQSAGRIALGLGAAAVLGIDTEGGVPTINAGKINPSFIPAITFGSEPFPVADEAARLALSSAVVGSIAIQASPASNWVLRALPASTAGNWLEFAVPGGTVSSVFGLTGAVAITGMTGMTGAAALNDLVAGYDTSVGAHRSITLQKIIDLVAVPAAATAAPPDIGTASVGTGTAYALANHNHDLPNTGTAGTTNYPASITTDAKGRVTGVTAGSAPPSPSNAIPQPIGTATAGASNNYAREGHTHAIFVIPGVAETASPRTDVSSVGNIALGATAAIPAVNIYWARLTGTPVTINLPALVPAVGTAVSFSVWIDQDATGGRACTFNPPAGYSVEWDSGVYSQPLSGANKLTEYVFRIGGGSTVFRASKTYQNG